GELERLAREARTQAEKRRQARTRFDAAVADAGLEPIAGHDAFTELTALVAAQRPRLKEEKRRLDAAVAGAIRRDKALRVQGDAIRAELASLEQRTSNLPVEQVDVREKLCADLGVPTEELPYAGELLDMRDVYAEWRGAAERVLRGFALSLLV